MSQRIARIEEDEEKSRVKRNEQFALVSKYMQEMHSEETSGKVSKNELEERVDKLFPHISNLFAPQNTPQMLKASLLPKEATVKEISSLAPQILQLNKTAKPTFLMPPPAPQIQETDPKLVESPEIIEEEAAVEDTNPESAQRQNLWEIWQQAADELEKALQDQATDPFDSDAAQRVMALCSYLASQMNHETARSLLNFIEDYRMKKVKKSYQPGIKEYGLIGIQLMGAVVAGFCGFYPAATGLVGSSSKTWDTASQFCNAFLGNGAGNVAQLNNTVNQGKQSISGHEMENDKRQQQDLEHRRQQADQAATREFENIKRMMQQKTETVRSINS